MSTKESTEQLSADWIAALPTATSPLDELVDYPASTYPGEETIVISTRVPISWASQFEEFRDKIGSRLPRKIWARNSDLARWCIGYGFKHLRKLQEQLDRGEIEPTPALAVQHFLENVGSRIVAHAAMREDAKYKAKRLVETASSMYEDGQYVEAAELVLLWVDGARAFKESAPYWYDTMLVILTQTPGAVTLLEQLVEGGYIVDDELRSIVGRAGSEEAE